MAQNLVAGGHKLVLYDVSPGRMGEVGEGGEGVSSPAEVARRAETIITMLPSGENVMDCYAGENGILRFVISGYWEFEFSFALLTLSALYCS